MPRMFRWPGPVLVALFVLSTLFAIPGEAAPPTVYAPSAPAADKHYFALRAVAAVHRQLVFNPKGLPPAEVITDVRLQLAALENLFVKEGVDEELVQMLGDVQKLADEYLRYARTIDAIDDAALEKLNARMGLGERFGTALASAGAGALIEPLTGPVVGFFAGFFLSEWFDEATRQRKAGKINDERWTQIQTAKSELENHLEADYLRHQKVVKKLATKYRWKAGESGLDATDEETAGFHKSPVTANNDIDAAVLDERLQGLSAWMKRRPRDPFTRLEYTALAGQRECVKKRETPAQMRASAARLAELTRDGVAALDHVPPGERYNPYRAEILLVAGDLASTAAALEVLAQGRGAFGGESRYAATAVKLWKDCFRFRDEVDPSGYIRMRLAFALVHDGQLKKGFALADEVAKLRRAERCPQFACNYARLKAMAGESDVAIEWLEHAVASCGVNPSGFPDDPHLLPLKKSQPARFEALFTKRP